jgi:hypothetical protein
MPRAGYCHDCGAYVWLNEVWCCPEGHARERVNTWYDPDTGQPLTPPWTQQQAASPAPAPVVAPPAPEPTPAPAPAPAPEPAPAAPGASSRVDLLHAMLAAFAQYPGYAVRYGTDTDVMIDNKVAEGSWGTGKKKVEFEAIMKAVEPDLTVFYWEILKEKGAGLSLGGFQTETYSTFGTARSGATKEVIIGPGGTVAYEWDYGQTRQIVEATAAQHGWKVKTVLKKGSAQW